MSRMIVRTVFVCSGSWLGNVALLVEGLGFKLSAA